MAARRTGGGGGGPWRELLSAIATLVMACVLVVALVSSGGWRAVSEAVGVGNPDAATSDLTASHGTVGRRDDAVPLDRWLRGLTAGDGTAPTPGMDAGDAGPGEDAGAADPDTSSDMSDTSSDTDASDESDNASDKSDNAAAQDALRLLDSIPVAAAHTDGYDREDAFGGWASAGCGKATTRDSILARDLTGTVRDAACRVESGTLADPYTGDTVAFRRGAKTSMSVQIDHVVALQDAWASGAWEWSRERRVEYANSADVLLAVGGRANSAKGAGVDFDSTGRWRAQGTGAPDLWMPDNKAYRCEYTIRRVGVKSAWGLSMTDAEAQETRLLLASCAAGA